MAMPQYDVRRSLGAIIRADLPQVLRSCHSTQLDECLLIRCAVINQRRQQPEKERRHVYPELVKGNVIVMYGPNHGDVFHRDEYPANQDDFFDPGIAWCRSLYAHFADKRAVDSTGRPARFE